MRSARFVHVRSVTGWSTTLERAELDGALLATHVAGLRCRPRTGRPCASSSPDAAASTGSRVESIDVA